MSHQESIFRSSIRTFFTSFFKGFGFLLALIPILLIIAGIGAIKDDLPEKEFHEKVMPDADGKRTMISSSKPKILQIDVQGVIGTNKLNHEKIVDMLIQSREGDLAHDRVKGILLSINTPGGTVIDSDGIYHAIKSYKSQYNVPVYAYVDGLCASGGMYVASAADKVYASNVSLVGSVGVILSTFPNVSETLDKIGVTTVTVAAGKGKDAMNPFRPWKDNESENFQMLTDHYYHQFVDLVAQNRPAVSKEKLVSDYGAKIYPASTALEIGLIDVDNASRKQALTDLIKECGIEENYQVVTLEKETWMDAFFDAKSPLFTGKIEHTLQLNGSLPAELHHKFLYLEPSLL